MALGYTDYEEGFRHGKRDYCAGIRSQALLNNPDRYSEGYRAGIKDSEAIQAKWLNVEVQS